MRFSLFFFIFFKGLEKKVFLFLYSRAVSLRLTSIYQSVVRTVAGAYDSFGWSSRSVCVCFFYALSYRDTVCEQKLWKLLTLLSRALFRKIANWLRASVVVASYACCTKTRANTFAQLSLSHTEWTPHRRLTLSALGFLKKHKCLRDTAAHLSIHLVSASAVLSAEKLRRVIHESVTKTWDALLTDMGFCVYVYTRLGVCAL